MPAADVPWPGPAGGISRSKGGMTAAGRAACLLAFQIARFGELAGRDLSARAFAALRARGAGDPRRPGQARSCPPLTAGEQREMRALRAAITSGPGPAAAAGAAGAGHPGPGRLVPPGRLRRRPSPDPGRAAGRHHRVTGTGPGAAPGTPVPGPRAAAHGEPGVTVP
jgi:hypothetical protein